MIPEGPASIAIVLLLTVAGLVCVLSVAGLVVMKGFYLKLHYLAPPAVVATAAVVAAVFVAEGITTSSMKALLVFFVLAISNAVLTHAAARAQYLRERRGAEGNQSQQASPKR